MSQMLVSRQRLPLIADLAVISLALAFFNFVQPGFDFWIALSSLIAAYAYIAYYTLSSIEVVGGIRIRLTVEFGFVAFYYILFFWPYQQELLGIGVHYYESGLVQNGYAEGANKALLLSIAGLAAFHLGSSFLPTVTPNPQRSREQIRAYAPFDLLLAIIMVASFTLFIFLDVEPDDLARYQRVAAQVGEEASAVENGVYLLTILLCLIGVARIVSHLHFRRRLLLRHWTIIAATGFWMIYILAGGDRNNFLVIALGAAGGVAAFVREIRWPVILAAVVPALIIYNTVEVYRMASDRSLAGLEEAYNDAGTRDADQSSFALTTLTLRATFDIAPDAEPYALGYYKVIGFGGVVPLVRGVLLGQNPQFTDTSQVLAYYILGPNATWSLGSNPISDLYFDFGPLGVVAGLALLGYVATSVRNFITKNGPSAPRIFLYIALLAMMSEVPRYSIDFPVRIVAWGFFVFWLYEKLNPVARSAARRVPIPSVARLNGAPRSSTN